MSLHVAIHTEPYKTLNTAVQQFVQNLKTCFKVLYKLLVMTQYRSKRVAI